MKQLTYELVQLTKRNRDGSFMTQANRRTILAQMADQLIHLGYKDLHATDLKGRHIDKLLALWHTQGLSGATIRNRLSVLRWWAHKINRVSILPKDNALYALPPRQFVARTSKAQTVPNDVLMRVQDRWVRASLELQRAFGLRREESIKIRLWQADQGQYLVLQGSWTKGGRPRQIPIVTAAQHEVLDRLKQTLPNKEASLIPTHRTYIQQRYRYDDWVKRVGLHNMHGLRHAYAQRRFLELAGFPSPLAGGPTRKELTPEQAIVDEEARIIVSAELGHGRLAITRVYLG